MVDPEGTETQTAPNQGGGRTPYDAGRAATLAKLVAGEAAADEKPAAKPSEKTAESKPSPAAVAETSESTADSPDDAGANEAGDGDDADPSEADPETDKRLAIVHRNEKLARERLKREHDTARTDLEKVRAALEKEWAPKVESAKKYEAAIANKDIVATLKALGYDEDSFEEASQILYGLSKKGASDPKYRATAEQLIDKRKTRDEIAEMKRQHAELQEKIERQSTTAELQRAVGEYLDGAVKAVAADSPLAKLAEKNPSKLRKQLHEVAVEMIDESGHAPKHAAVIAELEKRRLAELEELGVDTAPFRKAAPTAAKDGKKAAATDKKAATAAKKLTDDEMSKLTPKERRAELLRRLEAGETE